MRRHEFRAGIIVVGDEWLQLGVVGKGLPNPKDPARRCDLIVNFDILFPERLSMATRDLF